MDSNMCLCVYLAMVHHASIVPHTYLQDQSLTVWQLCPNSPIDLSAANNTISCQDGFK